MRLGFILVLILFHPSQVFSEESILNRLYQEGGQAWLAGKTQAALNAWLKYREIACRLDESNRSAQYQEVEALTQNAKLQLKKAGPVVPPSIPNLEIPSEKKKMARPKPREKVVAVKQDPALLNKLLIQAQRASESGRFEDACRFYRLALQVDSNNLIAANKLKELEQMMRSE